MSEGAVMEKNLCSFFYKRCVVADLGAGLEGENTSLRFAGNVLERKQLENNAQSRKPLEFWTTSSHTWLHRLLRVT